MAYGSEVEKLERRWMENPMGVSFAPLAEAYRRAGDPARALEVLGIGLANHPAYVPALIVQARCHLDAGAVPAAEESFRAVLGTDAHNIIALKGLADLCEQGGRPEEAARHLERLLEADPTHDDARHQLDRMAALIRERQPSAETAPGAEASAAAAAVPVPEEPVGFEPTSAEVVLAEEEWSTTIDLGMEPSAPLEAPGEGGTDGGVASGEGHPALESSAHAPAMEVAPDAASEAPAPPAADDLGIEKEVGPFDAFEAGTWSDEGLGLDAVPETPFEEELPAPWIEPVSEWASGDETVLPDLSNASAAPPHAHPEEPASQPPVAADTPDTAAPWVADERWEADAEPSAGGDLTVAEPTAGATEADGLAAPADAGPGPEPRVESEGGERVAPGGAEPGSGQGVMGASPEPEPVPVPELGGEPPAVAEPVSPVVAGALPALAEPPRPWDEWAAAVVGADPGTEPESRPEEPGPPAGETAEVAVSPVEEELVAVVEGAEAELPADEPAGIEPELVITETMAKLFERQGHLTLALAVYAELLERDPLSPGLAEAIQRVRGQLGGDSTAALGAMIASRGGGARPEAGSVLDAAPTRPGADHLSLDAVFGGPRGRGPGPGGVPPVSPAGDEPSFDEFFGEAGVSAAGAGRAQDADTDLEQFNAWLRSLKR